MLEGKECPAALLLFVATNILHTAGSMHTAARLQDSGSNFCFLYNSATDFLGETGQKYFLGSIWPKFQIPYL